MAFLSSPLIMAAGLGALALIAAAPGVYALARGSSQSDRLDKRLEGGKPARKTKAASGGAASGLFGAVARFGQRSAPGDAGEVSAMRFKLIQAGFADRSAVSWYYAARFVCVVVPQIVLLFTLPVFKTLPMPGLAPVMTSIFLALLGLALPGIVVDRRIEARKLACSDGFPDMMDLMVACVEAGLSLDAAVARVGEELKDRHPVLSGHLRNISLELRAGRSPRDAWRNFADRLGLEEAGSLATMLRQAEEMGTSLGSTLRIFSRDMRRRRILIAEEKAMALPAKMTVPLILFVFPVLLGVLVLPAAFRFQIVFAAS